MKEKKRKEKLIDENMCGPTQSTLKNERILEKTKKRSKNVKLTIDSTRSSGTSTFEGDTSKTTLDTNYKMPAVKNPPNKNSASLCSAQYGTGYDQTNTVESNDDFDSLLNIS